jgi:hypothetical protein
MTALRVALASLIAPPGPYGPSPQG